MSDYLPLKDYAIIGDCRAAALVGRNGSIDWWCPLRFDTPSIFGALLSPKSGGALRFSPTGDSETHRRYVGDSNVLETTFTLPGGQVTLTDFMPVGPGDRPGLFPSGSIIRVAECTAGRVELEVHYAPRFDYGRVTPAIHLQHANTFISTHTSDAVALRADFPLDLDPSGTSVHGVTAIQQGERRVLAVSFAQGEPLILGPIGEEAARLSRMSIDCWNAWSEHGSYHGSYETAVRRSALVLKLLTYAPSGAIIAAPTTSLPEGIGGERNWDYRYCWLRDASLSVRALTGLGHQNEADTYFSWLIHTTNLTWPRLRVLYDVFGGLPPDETTLDHLDGYLGSRPVRVGNAASEQVQLDVYGEVVGAAFNFVKSGGSLGRSSLKRLVHLGEIVCKSWNEPDAGIWEVRSGPYFHVYSRMMCWCVLERLLTLAREDGIRMPIARFRETRDEIRETIERDGYDPEIESYIQRSGSRIPDASLLLLSTHGYVDPAAPRMRSTYSYLAHHLRRNGLWYRYPIGTDDGLSGQEGAFLACTFWAADYLAQRGDLDEAQETFECGLSCANDVGLLAEEADPETGFALGNYPQAFSHIGLINAALTISQQLETRGSGNS